MEDVRVHHDDDAREQRESVRRQDEQQHAEIRSPTLPFGHEVVATEREAAEAPEHETGGEGGHRPVDRRDLVAVFRRCTKLRSERLPDLFVLVIQRENENGEQQLCAVVAEASLGTADRMVLMVDVLHFKNSNENSVEFHFRLVEKRTAMMEEIPFRQLS